ncbi:MAG: choice-of-anchor J domain-containing protein, partial [Ginsengibacter sp.]
MKRIPLIFFLVIAFFASRQATAQQVNEGFESNTFPPPGWDTINVSGTARWVSSIQSGKIHSGSKAAYGQFETQPAPTTADNWLITPKIYSITATDNLNFWSIADYSDIDNGFFDTLYVLVSTTGKSTSNFTTQILKFATYTQTTYTQHTVSLSAFAGQNIYIAFRHFNQNGNGIFIDDVTAGTPLANDVANSALSFSQSGIVNTGTSVNITSILKNVGTNTINAGLPVKYTVNNGTAVSMVTSSAITAGNTTSVTFSGANAFTPTTPGTYVLKVFADAPSEINRGHDTLVYTFTVQNAISSFPYFQDFNNPQGWSFAGTGNWAYSNSETLAGLQVPVVNPAGTKGDFAAVARFYFTSA